MHTERNLLPGRFLCCSFGSPIHVRYFSFYANPSSSSIDYKFDRVSSSSCSHHHHLSIHTNAYIIVSSSSQQWKKCHGDLSVVFSVWDFTCIRIIEQKHEKSNARTCAIPMIMRNAAELLPSEYVCIGIEATLTYCSRSWPNIFPLYSICVSSFSCRNARLWLTVDNFFRVCWIHSIYVCV